MVFVVKYSLRSYYYTLGCAKTPHCVWSKSFIEFVRKCIPYDPLCPIFLEVDDTLVKKTVKIIILVNYMIMLSIMEYAICLVVVLYAL